MPDTESGYGDNAGSGAVRTKASGARLLPIVPARGTDVATNGEYKTLRHVHRKRREAAGLPECLGTSHMPIMRSAARYRATRSPRGERLPSVPESTVFVLLHTL